MHTSTFYSQSPRNPQITHIYAYLDEQEFQFSTSLEKEKKKLLKLCPLTTRRVIQLH